MDKFPDKKTLLHEKDRAAHAIMGFKVQRLWDPPYLQVACDIVDLGKLQAVLSALPENDHLIIEAGTPLVKKFGLNVISEIRKVKPNAFIIADMKILDTGNLEARMAADATADAVVVSDLRRSRPSRRPFPRPARWASTRSSICSTCRARLSSSRSSK